MFDFDLARSDVEVVANFFNYFRGSRQAEDDDIIEACFLEVLGIFFRISSDLLVFYLTRDIFDRFEIA